MNFHYSGQTRKKLPVGVKYPLWLAHLTFTHTWLAHLTPAYSEALFRLKLASKHLTWRKILNCSFIVCWCGWCLNLRSSGCSRCWWAKDEIYMKVSDYYLLVVTFVTMQRNHRRNVWIYSSLNQKQTIVFCTDLFPFCVCKCFITATVTNVRLVSQVTGPGVHQEGKLHIGCGCVTVNLLVYCLWRYGKQ